MYVRNLMSKVDMFIGVDAGLGDMDYAGHLGQGYRHVKIWIAQDFNIVDTQPIQTPVTGTLNSINDIVIVILECFVTRLIFSQYICDCIFENQLNKPIRFYCSSYDPVKS